MTVREGSSVKLSASARHTCQKSVSASLKYQPAGPEALGGGADRAPVLTELLDQLGSRAAVLVVVDLERVQDPGQRHRVARPVGRGNVDRVGLDPLQQRGLEVALRAVVDDLTRSRVKARDVPPRAVPGGLRGRRGLLGGQRRPVDQSRRTSIRRHRPACRPGRPPSRSCRSPSGRCRRRRACCRAGCRPAPAWAAAMSESLIPSV